MVVGGILTVALAWALPSFASQGPSGRTCSRYRSADDVNARSLARDAEVDAETLATDNDGIYTKVSPRTLQAIDPEIPITPRQARREHWRSYLLSAAGTTSSYHVTTRSQNGDTYTIRDNSGSIKRYALVCGKTRSW